MRIGQGYDIHRLVSGKSLVLGGVKIPFEKGEDGHSDGDVLIHAVIDAILGGMAAGDIGTHFPPTDARYKEIKSTILLTQTCELCFQQGYKIINVDTTIILEQPKLKDFIIPIRESLAGILDIPLTSISVKAKTKEKQDSTGQGMAIEAIAVVLLSSHN
ncbi:MAG: 2-C-methyl-D-erythritol 2,4-cyclodiphosphate synthase [Spirochaetales bacterium]|nr:2-C-methyl-D-erythritol 2,4-cyclodiphosphate synthase [Spirochaetales bacterium]